MLFVQLHCIKVVLLYSNISDEKFLIFCNYKQFCNFASCLIFKINFLVCKIKKSSEENQSSLLTRPFKFYLIYLSNVEKEKDYLHHERS